MEKENSNFVIELAKIMSVDGKVNIEKYSAILDLVSKNFDQKLGRNYVEPMGGLLVEEKRKSYNIGFKDSKKEQIIDFIKWLGNEDLKRYAEGWCQPGGSNGFHLSDEDLYNLFEENRRNQKLADVAFGS